MFLINKLKKAIYAIIAIIFLALTTAKAEGSLVVFDVDTSQYPVVSAKFFAFDENGEFIENASEYRLDITEDIISREIADVSCPETQSPVPVSIVLTIDVSGSMIDARLESAKQAAKAIIKSLPEGSECAITSFNHLNYLNADFTDDKTRLEAAVDNLRAGGGTSYNAAFIDSVAGALVVARKAKYKPTILFFTDGITNGSKSEIIEQANEINAEIHCVMFGLKTPPLLREIAEFTGGRVFDNIGGEDDAVKSFLGACALSREIKPCTASWISGGCETVRQVRADIVSLKIRDEFEYEIDPSILPAITAEPAFLEFENIVLGEPSSIQFTISARNDSVAVNGFTSSNPRFRILDEGQIPESFILEKDSSKTLTCEYLPIDSSYAFSTIKIFHSACSIKELYASGGDKAADDSETALQVTRPNGGEILRTGSDERIRWTGTLPDEKVWIEFSSDQGDSWTSVNDSAKGLSFQWRVPPVLSDKCLVRLKHISKSGFEKITLLESHESGVLAVSWKPGSEQIASASDDGAIKIWDIDNESAVFSYAGLITTPQSIAWSPDDTRIASAGFENDVILRDAGDFSLKTKLSGSESSLRAIAWSPSADKIAAGSGAGEILIWNVGEQHPSQTYKAHSGNISSLKWSASGEQIASSSWDGTAKIYDISSEQFIFSSSTYSREVFSCDLSPDNVLIAVQNKNKIDVYDLASQTIVKTLSGNESELLKTSWKPDGSILAATDRSGRVKLWSAADWSLIYVFHGHSDAAPEAEWNDDGSLIATGAYDRLVEIWSQDDIPIDDPIIQTDVSDEIFEIANIGAETVNVDFGEITLGLAKDSVAAAIIKNSGKIPFNIDSLEIRGDDAGGFSIISGDKPFSLAPGQSRDFELRFEPENIGFHSAEIIFYSDDDVFKAELTGVGADSKIRLLAKIIDFGKIPVGESADTTVAIVKNISSQNIEISARTVGPDLSQFSNNLGGETFFLAPNEEKTVVATFSPQIQGRSGCAIELTRADAAEPIAFSLFGDAIYFDVEHPQKIDFPLVICEISPIDSLFSVKNLSNETITFSGAGITGADSDFFEISQYFNKITLDRGDSATIAVRFRPIEAGEKSARLYFSASAIIGHSKTFEIELSARKEFMRFDISRDSIDFGYLDEFEDAEENFFLINNGTTPLFIDYPSDIGDFTFSRLKKSIPPGGEETLKAYFKGGLEGLKYEISYIFSDSCDFQRELYLTASVRSTSPRIFASDRINFPSDLCGDVPIDTTYELKNVGSDTLVLSNLQIMGANKNEFRIEGDFAGTKIPPDSTIEIKLVFDYADYEAKNATLLVESNDPDAPQFTANIFAQKDLSKFKLSRNEISINLGENSSATTTIDIVNEGSEPITWSYPIYLNKFEIRNIEPAQTPPGGGESVAEIVFEAAEPGIYSESHTFYDVCGNSEVLTMTAEVGSEKKEFNFKVIDFCGLPGDTVAVPFEIEPLSGATISDSGSLSFSLDISPDLLFPIGNTPAGEVVDDSRIIPVEISPTATTFSFGEFTVCSFEPEVAEITILSLISDNSIVVNASDGKFVSGCNRATIKPVGSSGNIRLLQNYPNPADKFTIIEYEILEKDVEIELSIFSVDSKRQIIVDDGFRRVGRHRIFVATEKLAIGAYIYYLRARSDNLSGKMEIMH